ncbi:AraC family transcriptional regulator [Actinomadura keratinilytica]
MTRVFAPSPPTRAPPAGRPRSRFLHLFKAHTGTSFRRYQLWARMLAAGRAVGTGGTLTSAAADAGFASTVHFSDAFRRVFGLQPSRLPADGLTIVDGTTA